MLSLKKNLFLGEELSAKEKSFNFSKFHILPIPLEKTVSYGTGTSKAPEIIINASNQLERNHNDPCDFGFCGEDGFFSGVIIYCAEQMGVPCDGEWVLEDGACCSNCVENASSDCESISITLNNGWNMIGFACLENTTATVAFAAIQDKIVIAKDGVGNAYLPDWNFNGIGELERGYGYLIKVSEEITNYNICD